MKVVETYAQRKREAEQSEPDVYTYGPPSDKLRKQVEFILDEAIGPYWTNPHAGFVTSEPRNNNAGWEFIRDTLKREFGVDRLAGKVEPKHDVLASVAIEEDIDQWLSVVELSCRYIDYLNDQVDKHERANLGITLRPEDAISELNYRFEKSAFGYRYEVDQIIRVDSEYLHSEVVKPALALLRNADFAGPTEEFLAAHEHYLAGEYKDAVVDAENAMESTMKSICDSFEWEYSSGARASDLVKILRENELFPSYLDSAFDQLLAVLRSGLPQVRNNAGGHGQGSELVETPKHVAGFALHLCASKIVFLVESMNNRKQ